MSSAGARQTPMMAQYLGLKQQHPDSILLFRMGDFYETFYEDAKDVSALLGVALTSRDKKAGAAIPLAGVPHHALDHYLARLLDAGRTVAICEQMEDPSQAKGLVRREVVEVISPGTVTNPALLSDAEARYLLALCLTRGEKHGYALLDSSTGEFRCGETTLSELTSLPRRYAIGELLLPEAAQLPSALASAFDGIPTHTASPLLFESGFAERALCDHFGVLATSGLGLSDLSKASAAAGAALRYLGDRQRRRPAQVTQIGIDRGDGLMLDRESIAHLELFVPLRQGDAKATLLHQLDRCRTPMGKRALVRWMRAPLCDLAAIAARHDHVEWFVQASTARERAREALRGMGDLERLLGRIATERAQPHELASLRAALSRAPALAQALDGCQLPSRHRLDAGLAELGELQQLLRQALVDEAPAHLRQGGAIRPGHDAELDRLNELAHGGKRWIAQFQEQERARTGIGSLKVTYHRVFGYHIEVSNGQLAKVPADYEEKQRLATGKRFATAELAAREREILVAESDVLRREAELFTLLLREVAERWLAKLQEFIAVLAEFDVLASLADVAHRRQWVRPMLDDSLRLELNAGRHPVVEELVRDPFVPNDLLLDPERRQLLVLTGPNMGGKSTYLRQSALLVILAQMGSFVPALAARIGWVDRIFTRVGASDDLARGQSTFLVEMSETANILRHASARSLVVLDEVGRGTSTDDGLALAWAITEYLHDGPARPRTLFATHYHELTQLVTRLPRAANIQMQVSEAEGRILFLHSVVPGASDRSYGVHVAELAGLPQSVLRRARELLASPPGTDAPRPVAAPLAPLRASEREVLDRLRELDPERLRPLDALTELARLRDRLEQD